MEIEIKSAEATDAEGVLELVKTLQSESKFFTVEDLGQMTVEQEADALDAIAQTDDNIVLLALADGEMIGLATIAKVDHQLAGELGIAVKKDFYHKGLGTALVDELIYWGENFSPLEKLTLSVIAENEPALGLYRKLGFKPKKVEMIADASGNETKVFIMELAL